MLRIRMRALWAFVVVCLMAAHGAAPAEAAALARDGAPVERISRADHPGLPAITEAHAASLLIATRARTPVPGLAWALAVEPPALHSHLRMQRIDASPDAPHACVGLVTIRSARGPPIR